MVWVNYPGMFFCCGQENVVSGFMSRAGVRRYFPPGSRPENVRLRDCTDMCRIGVPVCRSLFFYELHSLAVSRREEVLLAGA